MHFQLLHAKMNYQKHICQSYISYNFEQKCIHVQLISWKLLRRMWSFRCSHCLDLGGICITWQVKLFEDHVTCPFHTRYMLSHITWHFSSFPWSTFNCQFKLKNRCIHIQITLRKKTCCCPITNLWEWKYIPIWTLKE